MLPTGGIGQQPAVLCIPGTNLKQVVVQSTTQISHLGFLSERVHPASFLYRMRQRKNTILAAAGLPVQTTQRYQSYPLSLLFEVLPHDDLYPFRVIMLPIALPHIVRISERARRIRRANGKSERGFVVILLLGSYYLRHFQYVAVSSSDVLGEINVCGTTPMLQFSDHKTKPMFQIAAYASQSTIVEH